MKTMQLLMQFLTASKNPLAVIKAAAYKGQSPMLRQYREGYEHYMDQLPILSDDDPLLEDKVALSDAKMEQLANVLAISPWVGKKLPEPGGFSRTIIAVAEGLDEQGKLTAAHELLVAKWGDGFTSPIHGHAVGLLNEKLIAGVIRVNTYRMTTKSSTKVRPVELRILKGRKDIVSTYAMNNPDNKFKRQSLIHSFTSVGQSSSLHYVAEHTRDGRDNKFDVEHFHDKYGLHPTDLVQIDTKQGMSLRPGDVALVRSLNVPEYGDHYIVITGPAIMKDHGMRPQEKAIEAPGVALLDTYDPFNGVILLKLKQPAKEAFLEYHKIKVMKDEVIFPEA